MVLFAVNKSYKYVGFTHLHWFPRVVIHPTNSKITRSITSIFIFINSRNTKINNSIFIFVCNRGTSTITITNTSTFIISIISKLAYNFSYSKSIHTIICPPPLYSFWISSHSSDIEILRRLRMVLSTDLLGEGKTRSFKPMFD